MTLPAPPQARTTCLTPSPWLLVALLGLMISFPGCQAASTTDPPEPPASPSRPTADDLVALNIDIPINTPTLNTPVAAAVGIGPNQATPESSVVLVVKVRIAPTWHIYPTNFDTSTAPMIPTGLTLHLPEGIMPQGNWLLPQAHVDPISMLQVLDGEIEFRHLLRIGPSVAKGDYEVTCDLSFQVCDPLSCLPPETRNLVSSLSVVADN